MTSQDGVLTPSLLLPLLLLASVPTSTASSSLDRRHHRHHHIQGTVQDPGLQARPPEDIPTGARLFPAGRCPCPASYRETYCRPRLIPFAQRCAGDQICRGVRMVCETAYREAARPRLACCPSAMPSAVPGARRTQDCQQQQPLCHPGCDNGGTCERSDVCACPAGFTGHRCQTDLDECDESASRRCDHVCVNTVGSFRCDCRPGFVLQPDGRSCQPLGKPVGIAPDPTDGDFEFLAKKLAKLEKILLVRQRHELEEEAEETEEDISHGAAKLSARIDSLQAEIHRMNQAQYQRCTHIHERLTRLEDSCSRITLVEHKIHQLASGCKNRNVNQIWP